MSGLFSPKMPPQRAEPTPPNLANPALDVARQAELAANQQMYGRAQTILTGGAPPPGSVQRKTLLGGG